MAFVVPIGVDISDGISIISTGLLGESDFPTLKYYTSIGPVFIQHWDDQDISIIPYVEGCNLVKSQLPSIPLSVPEEHKRFGYQFYGVLCALKHVRTTHVIRTRNDEWFTNFDCMVELFQKDTKRIISSSMLWSY